jgi:hypothetical protein
MKRFFIFKNRKPVTFRVYPNFRVSQYADDAEHDAIDLTKTPLFH